MTLILSNLCLTLLKNFLLSVALVLDSIKNSIKSESKSWQVMQALLIVNYFLGECKCHAGYKGQECEILCESGRYGIGCAYRCDCNVANSEGCDPITGNCICRPGWKGG